jgi:hypothetical protein
MRKGCRSLLVALLFATQAALGQGVPPESGWWWNPAEDGRGFFIEVQGGVLFMAAYFYAEDGRATWVVSAGPMTGDTSYTGRLIEVRGGQALFGGYRAPTSQADVGELRIEFASAGHGTLTWPGGQVPIHRQVFGLRTASFDPTGWWWNPAEDGRGFSIEVNDGRLFLAAFMYDDAGNPVWYISAGLMASETRYQGELIEVGGGQTMTGAYQPPSSLTTVGTITVDFASTQQATLTLSDATSVAIRPVKAGGGVIQIIRGPIVSAAPPPPPANTLVFEGSTYRRTASTESTTGLTSNEVIEGKNIRWRELVSRPPGVPSQPNADPGWLLLELDAVSAPYLKIVFTENSLACNAAGIKIVNLQRGEGWLWFNTNTRQYRGDIRTKDPVDVSAVRSCPPSPIVQRFILHHDYVGFEQQGTATLVNINGRDHLQFSGNEPLQIFSPSPSFETRISGDWRFVQRR